MKKIIIFLILITNLNLFSQNTKETEIDKLFKLTQVNEMTSTLVDSILEKAKEIYKEIPEEYWIGIKKDINTIFFINDLKEVYKVNFTNEELRKLNNVLELGQQEVYREEVKKIDNQINELSNKFGQYVFITISKKIKVFFESSNLPAAARVK